MFVRAALPVGRRAVPDGAPGAASRRRAQRRVPRAAPPAGVTAVSEQLLRVRGLSVRFPQRRAGLFGAHRWLTAVDGVDLDVVAGQSVGIVGESGCGKSTLARAILGLVKPAAGSIDWRGTPVRPGDAAGLRRMRRELQVVFQDPVGSLDPRMTIGESVAEALVALEGPQSRADCDSRVAATLGEVGLDVVLARRALHDAAEIQHDHFVAEVPHHREIVADEH